MRVRAVHGPHGGFAPRQEHLLLLFATLLMRCMKHASEEDVFVTLATVREELRRALMRFRVRFEVFGGKGGITLNLH
jgi:hypothetical protein